MTFLRHLPEAAETRHHVFLLLDGFTHLSFAAALEPLRLANIASGLPLYSWQAVSVDGPAARSSGGTTIHVEGAFRGAGRRDTLVVVGGPGSAPAAPASLLALLRRHQAHGGALLGICGGVEVLAAAGLLNGQECAVDWQRLGSFPERYPTVMATDRAFVLGRISTAASGVAAADLMLQLIGQQSGGDIASLIGEMMVYGAARSPQARQQVSLTALLGVRNDVISGAIGLMHAHLDNVLPIAEICDRSGISVRQMERLFARYLKDSPIRYYTRLRLEKARALLRDTDLPVIEISVACGFGGASQFSKTYRKHFGTSPNAFRAVQLAALA